MKTPRIQIFYAVMTLCGLLLPNFFVLRESLATDNWLLWADPVQTAELAFANQVASAFVSDLFLVVATAFAWMTREARRLRIRRVGLYMLATMVFGLAFGLPLFLYARDKVLVRE